ncbi:hypothetical protein BH20VER1_BH20VER1_10770 [soil metagenome]
MVRRGRFKRGKYHPVADSIRTPHYESRNPTEQILGIRFFNGSAEEAVATMCASGGLGAAPTERAAGFRIGVLKQLLRVRNAQARSAVWVLPHERARDRLLSWAEEQRVPVEAADCYIAPIYGQSVTDPALLALIEARMPLDVIIGIGAGPQEKLGWYLREHASYRPAIYCVGGALGFITGDQVAIPDWADRLYLGWFLRLLWQPRVFIPRVRDRFAPGSLAATTGHYVMS